MLVLRGVANIFLPMFVKCCWNNSMCSSVWSFWVAKARFRSSPQKVAVFSEAVDALHPSSQHFTLPGLQANFNCIMIHVLRNCSRGLCPVRQKPCNSIFGNLLSFPFSNRKYLWLTFKLSIDFDVTAMSTIFSRQSRRKFNSYLQTFQGSTPWKFDTNFRMPPSTCHRLPFDSPIRPS